MSNKPLVLIGGGGHCKSVIDVAECAGFSVLGILDKPEKVGEKVLKYQVIGTDDDIAKYVRKAEFVITVGQIDSPVLRIKLHEMVKQAGGCLATIVAPTAHVSQYARIGEGTVVMHHSMVNADAVIGESCIINNFANIEHDVTMGGFCHISTGTMVNGNCTIGNGVFIGSQSVINHGLTICDGAIIGSLSVVNKNIQNKGVYAGVPAKFLKGDDC